MKALLFPGQGSQYLGMAKDFYDNHAESRALIESADRLLSEQFGYRISDIMFSGNEEQLKQTRYTQPAIFLHSLVTAQFIERDDISITAGHSLGEYSAACFAGALRFEDALLIVARRGALMQEAGEKTVGSMAAIIGLSPEKLAVVLAEAGTDGVIQAANFNSPGQIVVSGDAAAIKKSLIIAKNYGAKLAKELAVSGAFHSPLMKPAEAQLADALNRIEIRDAQIPVCMNVSALPVTGAAEIRENLIEQLTRPVLWEQSVLKMVELGVAEFIEAGPQKVLQGLVKRTAPHAKLGGIDKFTEVAAFAAVASHSI